jgi:transcriptional activator SPT7
MFGDLLGEDYLGLEASGILGEMGISNLSIPKRLWKGKKDGEDPAGIGYVTITRSIYQ